jgi:hypothetical protein
MVKSKNPFRLNLPPEYEEPFNVVDQNNLTQEEELELHQKLEAIINHFRSERSEGALAGLDDKAAVAWEIVAQLALKYVPGLNPKGSKRTPRREKIWSPGANVGLVIAVENQMKKMEKSNTKPTIRGACFILAKTPFWKEFLINRSDKKRGETMRTRYQHLKGANDSDGEIEIIIDWNEEN